MMKNGSFRQCQVGLVVHLCLSSVSLVSCYLAVRHQLPMEPLAL